MHTTGHCSSTRERCTPYERPVVYVVDGDTTVAESLDISIPSRGWRLQTAASAEEFLARPRIPAPSCLVLETHLPGLSGLGLQHTLADQLEMPIIFMSARADIKTVVEAMKAGAFEFLVKPCPTEALTATIAAAIDRSRDQLQKLGRVRSLEERYQSLSDRERDVMRLIVTGCLNKQVAAELGISEITVKAHRGRAMKKMHAKSFAELVGMSAYLPQGAGAYRRTDGFRVMRLPPSNTFVQLQSLAGLRLPQAFAGF